MLAAEPLLTARLEQLAGIKGVHGLPELVAAEMANRPSPCLYVIYDGYQVLESATRGKAAKVKTRWLVVLSVKHASNSADGAPARSAAQPLLDAVLGQLLGWQPAAGFEPMELAPAPRQDFAAGQLLFPLAFTTVHVVKAN